jgi:hypothetical protein
MWMFGEAVEIILEIFARRRRGAQNQNGGKYTAEAENGAKNITSPLF